MENTRRRDGSSEQNLPGSNKNHQRITTPSGFEGMNFEQQRGSYKNSYKGGAASEANGKDSKDSKGQP